MDNNDLCKIKDLSDESILSILEERLKNSKIYTKSGLLLLSVNPYKDLNLYNQKIKDLYRIKNNLEPHLYSLIEECINNIDLYGDHSIIISGESGTGKTECSKYILDYFNINIMDDINFLTESFGNAKTKYNDNSSRFAKLIRINSFININTFLLEKSRVTDSSKNDYNFHVFYYILSGNDLIINNDYINNENIDNSLYLSSYNRLKSIFNKLNIDFNQIQNIILAIIYLGSLKIADKSLVKDSFYFNINKLLKIKDSDLDNYLLFKDFKIKGESFKKHYSKENSITLRNSLSRILYCNLFDFIINKINIYLKNYSTDIKGINILDIFGFENFKNNTLDQFCINYSNEKIYDEFVNNCYNDQKSIFLKEGITTEIKNMKKSNVDIIEKPCGLIDLISEESFLNGSYKNLSIKISNLIKLKTISDEFLVFNHFCDTVNYNLKDFLSKNKEIGNINIVNIDFIKNKNILNEDVVQYFKNNLKNLFYLLNKTKIKYIKCIKPNNSKTPLKFNKKKVLKQLKANGILKSIQISKILFPYHLLIKDFDLRYKNIDFNQIKGKLIKGKKRYFFDNQCLINLERNLKINEMEEKNKIEMKKNLIKIFIKNLIKKIKNDKKKEIEEMNKKEMEEIKINEKNKNFIINLNDNNKDLNINIDNNNKDNNNNINNNNIDNNKDINNNNIDNNKDNINNNNINKDINNNNINNNNIDNNNKDNNNINIDNNNNIKDNINIIKDIKNLSLKNKTLNKKPFNINKYFHDLDNNSKAQLHIQKLEKELIKYKNYASSCPKCKVLEQKYKLQTEKLKRKQNLQNEIDILRKRLEKYENEDSSSDNLEKISIYNVFGCIIQLFIENCPVYSENDIPQDEILSLSHCLYENIKKLREEDFNENISIVLEEIYKRIKNIENNLNINIFLLSNSIELFILFKLELNNINKENFIVLNDINIILFDNICNILKNRTKTFLPYSILEHQELRELKVYESLYKQLFLGPSIKDLVRNYEFLLENLSFYYLPENVIHNVFGYLFSYTDFEVFNSLLIKKNFLSFKRCAQINFNLSEINKFCYKFGFIDSKLSLGFITEAIKVATSISANLAIETEKTILNNFQINSIIDLFNKNIKKIINKNINEKFIKEPYPIFPTIEIIKGAKAYATPFYIPRKSLKSILKRFENK